MYCAVFGCCSSNKKKSKSYTKCRFFTFPRDKKMCAEWIHKCCQKHKFNIKTARICSKHFTNDDFLLRERLLELPKDKWKLKPDAIPSLHLASKIQVHTETSTNTNREKRMIKRKCLRTISR